MFPSLPLWQDTVLSQRLLYFSIFFLDFELPILPKGNTYPSAALEKNSSFTPAILQKENCYCSPGILLCPSLAQRGIWVPVSPGSSFQCFPSAVNRGGTVPLGGGQGSHDLLLPETPQSPDLICRAEAENEDGVKRFCKS